MIDEPKLDILASDVTGQTVVNVGIDAGDREMSVGELLDGLVPRMKLPRLGNGGRPLTYHARLEREGRHLHATEVVGEALQPKDRIMIQPTIEAGGNHR
ncbi:MAG: hypothetical protein ABSH38_00915 [Verrucomicrobiota bacterium]|jgi:hypothetical protein